MSDSLLIFVTRFCLESLLLFAVNHRDLYAAAAAAAAAAGAAWSLNYQRQGTASSRRSNIMWT